MKKITQVRKALDQIDARMKFEPENDFLGNEDGIGVETIHSGDLGSEAEGRKLSELDSAPSTQSDRDEKNGFDLQPEILVEFGAAIDDKLPLLT